MNIPLQLSHPKSSLSSLLLFLSTLLLKLPPPLSLSMTASTVTTSAEEEEEAAETRPHISNGLSTIPPVARSSQGLSGVLRRHEYKLSI